MYSLADFKRDLLDPHYERMAAQVRAEKPRMLCVVFTLDGLQYESWVCRGQGHNSRGATAEIAYRRWTDLLFQHGRGE
jgi:hypothetical protein